MRKSVSASLIALLGFLLTGCSGSQNASKQQIQLGYQPNPAYNSNVVNMDRRGDNEFLASLRTLPTVEVQKNSTWCWAASSAALINYDPTSGSVHNMTQDDVIRSMAAHKSNQSANEMDIVLALTQDMAPQLISAKKSYYSKPHEAELADYNPFDGSNQRNDTSHGYYKAEIPPLPGAQGLVDEILNGRPAIVGIDPSSGDMGHVVTAVAVRFSMASTDVAFGTRTPYFVREIVAIDPATGSQKSFLAIDGSQNGEKSAIDRVSFAISRTTARNYVKQLVIAYQKPTWVPATPAQAPPPSNGNTRKIKIFGR
jgi:hypothetical protein